MTKTLSDVCLIIVDCEHKTAPKSEEGYPLIRTTDIGRGRIDLSDIQRVDAAAYEEWTTRAVPQPNDLILAREAPVGNVAIVTAGMEPVLGQRTVLIRPDPEIVDPDFLTYRLLGYDIQHWMSGVANGATLPHLNMEDIRALPLPELPDLEIQRRLGATLAAFDDLIESNRRRIEILEEMARLIYREWFERFRFPGHEDIELVSLNQRPIPMGWRWGTFGELVEVSRNSTELGDIPSDAALVGLEHLPRRSITLTEWDLADGVGSRKSCFHRNDILFGKIRPYFHKVVSAPMSGYCSTDAIVFRARAERDQMMALAVASSDEFVAYATQTANGTKMPRANTEVLLQYPVPMASAAIRRRFEQTVGPWVRLCKSLAAQNRILRESRDLLLPRLVSGELDVLDLAPESEAVR